MATVTLKMDEELIEEIKKISKIYDISLSEFIRKATQKEVEYKKTEFFYKLNNVDFCSDEEEKELSKVLNKLTDDDLEIVERTAIEI